MKNLVNLLLENTGVQNAMNFVENDRELTLQQQLDLVQIPAFSRHEAEKSAAYLKLMEAVGLSDVHMDEVGNVFGTYKGKGGGPKLMVAAHIDTVFPLDTDLTIRREDGKIFCPGICDDTRALAELLSMARALVASGIETEGDIVFVGNVGEEGLGDLYGVKHIFKGETDIDAFITVDGGYPGSVLLGGTGSYRYEAIMKGKGGHSFAEFGLPNPTHALGRAIAMIGDIEVPAEPKTTFNVGVVNGGTSVNSIAMEAKMLIDLRSNDPEELEKLDAKVRMCLENAVNAENYRWQHPTEKVELVLNRIGTRPAASIDKNHPLLECSMAAAEALGYERRYDAPGSTDANIPLSLGIPATAVGKGGEGGGAHTTGEWFKPVEEHRGVQKNLLMTLLMVGVKGFVPAQIEKRK